VIVLGIDTSTQATAVAVRGRDGVAAEARDDPASGEHPGHATRLLALADSLLGRAGLHWEEIERIAVGLGPGTFTGLRVGVATARGLSQSLGAELVGVSSLRALAWGAAHSIDHPAAEPMLAVIDARRREVFAAAYALDDGLRELTVPRPLRAQDIEQVLREAERSIDGELAWAAYGDGAVRYRGALEAAGVSLAAAGSPLNAVRAEAICALGAQALPPVDEAVLPDYRRRPDAELALHAGAPAHGSPRA